MHLPYLCKRNQISTASKYNLTLSAQNTEIINIFNLKKVTL